MLLSRLTVARLLQITTLGSLLLAGAWLVWQWERSPWVAAVGSILIVFGYSVVLSLEFVALRWINRVDPAPLPGWGELAHAWLMETVQALRVFCWRQPFRSRHVPDRLVPHADLQGRRGLVFVHGFVCNRGFWTPWLEQLQARNCAFAAVNLEPAYASIDGYVQAIEVAIAAVTQASGLPPVLVCHSMGGLAVRAWLRSGDRSGRAHHIVTIGTPHHGTWLGRFSHLTNGRQMALGSQWLRQLEADSQAASTIGFTCWFSNCDNIVFPTSTATLPGADNRLVRGVAHVALAFQPQVIAATFALL